MVLQAFRSGGNFSVSQIWHKEMLVINRRCLANLMNWSVMDVIKKIRKELLIHGIEKWNLLATEIIFLNDDSKDRPYYNRESRTLFIPRPSDTDPNKIYAYIWNKLWEYLLPEIREMLQEIAPEDYEAMRIFLSQKFTNRSDLSKNLVNEDMLASNVNCEKVTLIKDLYDNRVLYPYINQLSKLNKDTEKLGEHITKIIQMMRNHFKPRNQKNFFYTANSGGLMILRVGNHYRIKSLTGKTSEEQILLPYVKAVETALSNNVKTVFVVSQGEDEIRVWGHNLANHFKSICGFKITLNTNSGSKIFIARLDLGNND